MTESSSGLSFEKAAYVDAGARAHAACGMCKRPLGSEYWKWLNQALCASCRDKAQRLLADSRSQVAFAKAAGLGGAAALGCGVAYALFVRTTHVSFALGTIGIAYAVGRVIRKASRGVGGLRYQVLAVVLTYLAAAMAYVPSIFLDLEDVFTQPAYLLHTLAMLPIAPIIAFTQSPLEALIVGFGLLQAWRITRAAAPAVEGPFRVASAVAPPAPAEP